MTSPPPQLRPALETLLLQHEMDLVVPVIQPYQVSLVIDNLLHLSSLRTLVML